jgi:hypothetical protein
MKIALIRASYPALLLLLFTVPFAVLAFAWPKEHGQVTWGQLLFSLGAAAVLSGVGYIGAAIGFRMLPLNRTLSRRRLFVLGILFAIVAFLGFVPAFDVVGMTGAVASVALLALGVAYLGGYLVSSRAA